MSERWVAAGLLLAALGLIGLHVLPSHAAAAAAWRDSALLRSAAERSTRRGDQEQGARTLRPAEGGTPSEAVRRVRRQVLDVLAPLPLQGVRLEVRESPAGPAVADIKLGARGRFADLVDLAGRLAASPGLALTTVRFAPQGGVAHVDVDARSR